MVSTPHDTIQRVYKKWFSPNVHRDMEFLMFGHAGIPVIFFPTRMGRFYDYEDWGVIQAMEDKILEGELQLFCVDSIDKDSFYCDSISPADRIKRHLQFEHYLLQELVPFIRHVNKHQKIISAGCSLGAFHAVNLAFRNPWFFKKVIGISGRYDLTIKLQYFKDLFDGYRNDAIFWNMPSQYVQSLNDHNQLKAIQQLDITLIIGKDDAFLQNNIELSDSLNKKNIPNALYMIEGEAHKPKYWGELMNRYL